MWGFGGKYCGVLGIELVTGILGAGEFQKMNTVDITGGPMSSGQTAPSDDELWLRAGRQHFETAYL
jgi:hypothetical protein